MNNTSCKECLFEKQEDKECYFDIPEIIKENKKIYKKEESLYIEDYTCRYCFSKRIYEENQELQQIDIIKHISSNAKIKYYLVISLDDIISSNNIIELCNIINSLDIKPTYISFINKNLKRAKDITTEIQSNIDINISWKLHNFIEDNTLQECITITLDTNMQKSNCSLFTVYKPEHNHLCRDILNNRINFLHMECVVKQNKFNAVIKDIKSLDGLSISFAAYKFLILNINKNILEAIQLEKEFKYIYYDSVNIDS